MSLKDNNFYNRLILIYIIIIVIKKNLNQGNLKYSTTFYDIELINNYFMILQINSEKK